MRLSKLVWIFWGACIMLIVGYSLMGTGMNPMNLMIGVPVLNSLPTTNALAVVGVFMAFVGWVLVGVVIVLFIVKEIRRAKYDRKNRSG